MREQYLKRVKKLLKVPRRKKREILRDLEESFASAAEHGETEQQVLDRLGTPEAFAAAMRSPSDEAACRRQRTLLWLGVSLAVCLGAFGLRAVLLAAWKWSLGIIGGADGPTVIFIAGPDSWPDDLLLNLMAGPAWASLLSLAGVAALIAAVIQTVRLLRQRRRRK